MEWFSRSLAKWRYKHLLFSQAELVVLDLELTGLDPKQHEIVSAGWLPIKNMRIEVKDAQHYLNKEVQSLEQSPVYHGIDSAQLASGYSLKTLLLALQQAIHGNVLVGHNVQMDWAFLKTAFQQFNLNVKPALMLDTMQIDKRRVLKQGYPLAQDALTLNACRMRYGLPLHQLHDALGDALATAELLLAQSQAICLGGKCKIADLT
ncbi:3'-5' exonuclease [Pseudoalteromonas sp. J010]|uniref:3'-5' exonuclease n=1 Tax=Pseudoalteromonas sp. J010 TaxID=998465 RepID=UPI000F6552AE|nr:3'-5' exonuclease [Pseudoalteromonas sp. J010]RRS07759.1 3'-5' exonuclease [Pseudoalteromonas sp. J010]